MVAITCNVHYYERDVNLEIRGARLPLPANRSPSPASPGRKCSPAQMQAHPYLLPALELDSRQQGRLCSTSCRGRRRTLRDVRRVNPKQKFGSERKCLISATILQDNRDMPNRAIEFHDSTFDSLERDGANVTLRFSEAYIHESNGEPGMAAGSGWVQEVRIHIGGASLSGSTTKGQSRLTWSKMGRYESSEQACDWS